MVKVAEMQTIIRALERDHLRVIGIKDESGVIISLREDSQIHLVQALCQAINDLDKSDHGFFDEYGPK